MILRDGQKRPIELGESVGRGGEAIVYRVIGQPTRLAKVYEPKPHAEQERKLAWMVQHPPINPTRASNHSSLAWPDGLLFDSLNRFKGYSMPFIRRTVPILDAFNPRRRESSGLPNTNAYFLYRVARNLASALEALHASGYVAGDLNESNILVTANALVTLIDTDSFQVTETQGGRVRVFTCPVGKPEYTPPELQGKHLAEIQRGPEHDNFSLGVLIFQLLMEGNHPFRAQWLGQGEAPQMVDRIASGVFPYTEKPSGMVLPPKNAPDINTLHPDLVKLIRRCFVDGYRAPRQRPTPQEWKRALEKAETLLVACPLNHLYSGHLRVCPYCVARSRRNNPRPTAGTPARVPPSTVQPVAAPLKPATTATPGNSANTRTPNVNGVISAWQRVNSQAQSSPTRSASPASNAANPANVTRVPPAAAASPRLSFMPGGVSGNIPTSRAASPSAAGSSHVWNRPTQTPAPSASQNWPVRPNAVVYPTAPQYTLPASGHGKLQPALRPTLNLHPRLVQMTSVRGWLWRRTYRSLLYGGGMGAIFGAAPGMLMGLFAYSNVSLPNWALLVAIGGSVAGLIRGWQPGYHLGNSIERLLGWKNFLQGLFLVMGLVIGGALGILLGWLIFPILIGPVLGAVAGRYFGEGLWKLGSRTGWDKIWATLVALGTAALGWTLAGLAGTGALSTLGPQLQATFESLGAQLPLSIVLASGCMAALGGMVAGTFADFISGLLGLID